MKPLLLLVAPMAFAQGLVEGNAQSRVRVLIYEDLQCSDCADFRKMLDQKLLPKYSTTVAFEHRDFPLAKHSWAKDAAVASRYFQELKPDLAVEYRREMMANLKLIVRESFEDHLVSFALKKKLDPAKVKAALKDERLRKLVDADMEEGVARGIARTPTVLVSGDPFIETFTYEEIAKSIDDHLAVVKK